MDQLHSEILLPIFKNLDSLDMVPVRAVCHKFLEIIDQNKSLWRHLVLPDSKQGGWDSRILDLWDGKSSSSLKEVSMHVKLEEDEVDPFIKTLERSKEALQILSIAASRLPTMTFLLIRSNSLEPWTSLAQLALVLPKVVDFRVMDPKSIHSVQLVENKAQEQKNAGLRVLWLKVGSKVIFKMMESQLLNTLISLKLELRVQSSRKLRAVLEGASQTLKHLYVYLPKTDEDVETLELPLLKCLEAHQVSSSFPIRLDFPSWIRIPSSTLVICDCITELPSVSSIWLKTKDMPSDLGSRAPRLEELRIDFRESASSKFFLPVRRAANSNSRNPVNPVVSLLDQRKKNVEELLVVEGVRMIPLKRLGICFESFSSKQIDEMRGLVEEVFDLKSVSMVVEIEI